MLEIIVENYKPIGKILLITIVFLSIIIYLFFGELRSHLKNNWSEYKKNPLFMPFAGVVSDSEGSSSIFQSAMNNFMDVLSGLIKSIFSVLMKPIYPILNIFTALLGSFSNILQKFRLQLNAIRGFLFKLFQNLLIKIHEGISGMTYFFLKLREILKKTFGIFGLTLLTLEHSQKFFESIVTDGKYPDGSPRETLANQLGRMATNAGYQLARFSFGIFIGPITWSNVLCFDPDTQIKTSRGYKKIKNIQIGEELEPNCQVYAKIIGYNPEKTWYCLNGVEVSGEHLVKHLDKFIMVMDHPESYIIEKKTKDVICLVTSNGIIKTKLNVFADYLDTHSCELARKIDNVVENHLNHTENRILSNHVDLLAGIDENIIINNDDIIGIAKIRPNWLNMYEIDNYYLSEKTLILENGKWVRVANHSRANYVGLKNINCVHYITKSQKIYLDNGLVLRDINETTDKNTIDIIDRMVYNNI